jgi:hypothetical protein
MLVFARAARSFDVHCAEPCGIGIQFRTDRTGAMVVQDLIEGGEGQFCHRLVALLCKLHAWLSSSD